MDSNHQRASSSASRRSSTAASSHRVSDQDSIPEDVALSDLVVADGFRPQPSSPSIASREPGHDVVSSSDETSSVSDVPPHPTLQLPQPQTDEASPAPQQTPTDTDSNTSSELRPIVPPERPSSCSKTSRPHESLSLGNDGSSNGLSNQSGTDVSAPTQFTLGSAQSGMGANPFQMYMQRAMGNSSDGSSQAGSHPGPTHPYSLYPQNTIAGEEAHDQNIPIGFPGMGGGYQRQIGPDGEDAGDLVGPMGHMEELPPYTRYPDGSQGSGSPAAAPQPPPEPAQQPAPAEMSGAGGLGLATRNPEFSSTEDDLATPRTQQSRENSHYSRQDTDSLEIQEIQEIQEIRPVRQVQEARGVQEPQGAQEAQGVPGVQEKESLGKWQQRAKKRAFGIFPYWAIGLLCIGLIIVGVVMGAVIGTVLRDDNSAGEGADDGDFSFGDVPAAVDVDLLPTKPIDTLPLATGFYALPPLDAWLGPRSCFNDSSQLQAWSCEMPFQYFTLDVATIPNASEVDNHEMILHAVDGTESISKYIWGTKPPSVTAPTRLRLVNDTFDANLGPAWWVQIVRNKTVIISEDNFNNKMKRGDWEYSGPSLNFDPTQFQKGSRAAEEGDMPWICTWPNTTMEIFIYPNKKSSLPLGSTSTATPTPTITEIAIDTDDDDDHNDKKQTPVYPQVIKFLERRLEADDDAVAYCSKVKVTKGGQDTEPVMGGDDLPIVVKVVEKQTPLSEQFNQQPRNRHGDSSKSKKSLKSRSLTKREVSELTDCGCLWWSL